MGSTKPERSITSSIPQWMKTKMNDRYDIAEPFSPPSYDDNFFYIRYPKSTVQPSVQQQDTICRPISVLVEKDPDLTRHTASCKQFMPQTKMSSDLPGNLMTKAKKSQGTDDGFTGEAAACGKSVVHVAQQMIAGKFVVENFDSSLGAESYDFHKRRGSKSLPASPLATPDSSPRFGRKQAPNRYFTGAFASTDKPNQEAKYPGGWILAGFLGQRENNISLAIPEEDVRSKEEPGLSTSPKGSLDVTTGMRRNKSTSVIGKLLAEETVDGVKVIRPKPSELREMNFWSPTSM